MSPIRSRASLTLSLACLVLAALGRAQDSKPAVGEVRATVTRALSWIARQAVPVDGVPDAVRFRPSADSDADPAPIVYGGSAGVLVFLENAAAVMNDEQARKLADATAKGLLASARRSGKSITWAGSADQPGASSLYVGDAGIGQAFLVRARLRKDDAALTTAVEVGDSLLASGIRDGDRLHWPDSQVDIIFGAAGTALFLLDLGAETKQPRFVEGAAAAGRWLVSRGAAGPLKTDSARKTLFWTTPIAGDRHMPNFSHGTAGVAYALARIGAAAKDDACASAARAGAAWLMDHAVHAGDTQAWPAVDGSKTMMGGWCHGPPGTARLFLLLHAQTGDARYLDTALSAARWLVGYADAATARGVKPKDVPPSLCCGVAGVTDFFCDLYRATGKAEFRDFAVRAGSYLLASARPDGDGVKWRNGASAHERSEDEFGIDLMLGASGEALALLRLATLSEPVDPVRALPDRSVGK